MNNWIKSGAMALASVGVLAVSNGAWAQSAVPTAPAQCSASRDSRGWEAGRAAGVSRVQSVWSSAAVRQDLDNLSDQLPALMSSLENTMVSLVNHQSVTQYVRCRAQGYVDGFFWRLNQLFGQCVLDGADWAQFAANLYCSLSAELGGLSQTSLFVRAPVGLCGNLFESTCEDVYRYVGMEGNYSIQPVIASYLESSGFQLEPYAGCAVFTQDAFLSVFEESLHNECTYIQQYLTFGRPNLRQ